MNKKDFFTGIVLGVVVAALVNGVFFFAARSCRPRHDLMHDSHRGHDGGYDEREGREDRGYGPRGGPGERAEERTGPRGHDWQSERGDDDGPRGNLREKLIKRLSLTEEQIAKLSPILDEFKASIDKSRRAQFESGREAITTFTQKASEILSDLQKEKFAEMRRKFEERFERRFNEHGAPPLGPPPANEIR